MFERYQSRRVVKLFVIILAIAAIAFFLIWFITDFLKNSELSILFTPSDSKILVNGEQFSNGVHRMYPGKVTIEISRDGFKTKTYDIELKANETSSIHGYLKPKDGSLEVFTYSASDYNIFKLVATDEDAITLINNQNKLLRIRDFLPAYNVADGSDGGSIKVEDGSNDKNCKGPFCILIKTNAKRTEAAYKAMKAFFALRGYNLDNYEVVYGNYD